MIRQYDRHQLEQFISQEHTILQECVDLLDRRIPLSDWSKDVRVAFLLAIQSGEGKEAYKAFSTSRHLRINRQFFDYEAPDNPTAFQRRCSERIRADLSRLVRLGAGSYLQK
jgi:predicted NACHT family NTPase